MSEVRDCPSCGIGGATVSMKRQEFGFLYEKKIETIIVHVPVISCGACGEEFTDWRGEEIRDAAVAVFRAERAREKANG